MKENFEKCLEFLLRHEGGYVNNRHDPGGSTYKGITQKNYDRYRASLEMVQQDVRKASAKEVREFYRTEYWNKVRGDELPAGVDHCVFDFAVNTDMRVVKKLLQRTVHATEDGVIGAKTLDAIKKLPYISIIDKLCDLRLEYLKTLRTWQYFGIGWASRVKQTRREAKSMVGEKI